MTGSLQDQLLNMGVASKKQAKNARTQKQQQKKSRKSGQLKGGPSEAQAGAQQALTKKLEKDRALNKEREKLRHDRAIQAQIKQLIESNSVLPAKDADVPYHFTHEQKVKKIYVTAELQERLSWGQLSIAVDGGSYRIIPTKVAERIAEITPDAVITAAHKENDLDDAYADYQIPDDLMW